MWCLSFYKHHTSGNYRRATYARSHPYAGKYSTKDECFQFYGVFKRKVGVDDVRQTRKSEV